MLSSVFLKVHKNTHGDTVVQQQNINYDILIAERDCTVGTG